MSEAALRSEPGLGRRPVERAFDRSSGGPPIPGNRVTLLQDGTEVYPAMLRLIAEAQHWIHFENYIIRADNIGAETFASRPLGAGPRGHRGSADLRLARVDRNTATLLEAAAQMPGWKFAASIHRT